MTKRPTAGYGSNLKTRSHELKSTLPPRLMVWPWPHYSGQVYIKTVLLGKITPVLCVSHFYKSQHVLSV